MHTNTGWFFFILALICLIGFGIDVMDIDAAQYASMSREMMQSGHYLQVYDIGQEYLDKPPFLFWISAISMKLFGVNNFAYRLPSFLFAILAVYSTYRLGCLLYNKKIAVLAALVLASCQGFFLMTHDVRTDTILMGWVIFSIWQLAIWFRTDQLLPFILGCAGIAGGMMTKGPIALLVPVFAFGSHFVLKRDFRQFFRWQYLMGIVIIALLLLPMCIGLYRQFDLHPEKLVNGKTGVSGLRFYFWTQSFGRITGESTWNNNSNIFFLLQNMLWSFLPWILFFLVALFLNIRDIIRQRFTLPNNQEAITTGGFIVTYLSLGLSKYQLPHYIFVVFPFAAIITARFLHGLLYEKKYRKLYSFLLSFHFIVFILLWMALIALLVIPFNTIPLYVPVIAGLLLTGLWFLFLKNRQSSLRLIMISLYTMVGLNLFLNSAFYPSLLRYQAGSTAGRWINDHKIPADKTFLYQYHVWRSLHFYAKGIIRHKDSLQDMKPGDYILTEDSKLPDFANRQIAYEVLHKGIDYPVSRLSLKFLNPAKREKQLKHYVFIKIK